MIRLLRVVLVVVVIVMIAVSVWVLIAKRVEARHRDAETQNALRKTAEFLKPDTNSDLRFGKPKATPSPANP